MIMATLIFWKHSVCNDTVLQFFVLWSLVRSIPESCSIYQALPVQLPSTFVLTIYLSYFLSEVYRDVAEEIALR